MWFRLFNLVSVAAGNEKQQLCFERRGGSWPGGGARREVPESRATRASLFLVSCNPQTQAGKKEGGEEKQREYAAALCLKTRVVAANQKGGGEKARRKGVGGRGVESTPSAANYWRGGRS
ncbi:hypothetical protein BHM03_00002049 [Ensete ventricosum]|nr:hypothetical protein BHM03_00002049 [Ensete ventricosum]